MSLQSPSALHQFIDKLSARSWLGDKERDAVLGLPSRAVQIRSNRDFVRLGETVGHCCLIVDGLVARFRQNRDGDRQITALHIAGDMADLHSMVMPEATSALQALSVTTLLEVPHRALRDVAARFPALAEAFWRECVIEAQVVSEWVLNVGRREAVSRLAHLLCEMACRYGRGRLEANMDYDFAATQQHLADMLGLTPVHVNRTLMALRRSEVVRMSGGRVFILDWSALARIGEFDPDYLHLERRAEAKPDLMILA